jgi:NAD-dependent dihydropyrimidine dehydrogenase PreA subunit
MKNKRQIIKIDEDKCNGCGLCIPNCPEGALQVIEGKARLISDLLCDGLGACLGHCPQGAIEVEERDAEAYDEKKTMENIIKAGPNVIKAHLEHLKSHGQKEYLAQALDVLKAKGIDDPLEPKPGHGHGHHAHAGGGCPGSRMMDFTGAASEKRTGPAPKVPSELRQWPIQLMLVPPFAPYLDGSDLLIAADCVPFAYGDFHSELLKGKTLLVGCPKLDDVGHYGEKLTEVFRNNNIKSVTYAHMEVPCCYGLVGAIESAVKASGKNVPFKDVTITIKGEKRT